MLTIVKSTGNGVTGVPHIYITRNKTVRGAKIVRSTIKQVETLDASYRMPPILHASSVVVLFVILVHFYFLVFDCLIKSVGLLFGVCASVV